MAYKKVYNWYNYDHKKTKKEDLGKESSTVPGQSTSIKELLRRHRSGQEVFGVQVDWNLDFPEEIVPIDQQQNLDLTDIDEAELQLEQIKDKVEKSKKKLEEEDKNRTKKNVQISDKEEKTEENDEK